MALTFNAIADFSACYKQNRKMPKGVPEGIIVHSTGANNPNLKRYVNAPDICGVNPNKNWFGGAGSETVIPHGVVGKDINGAVKAAQILPYDICCWGCGSGSKGSYNYNPAFVQFEIAEDGLTDSAYFNSAFDLMAQICVELIKTYPSIKIENVVSHKEAFARGYASNHGDPENWLSKFGKDMNWFRDKVESYLASNPVIEPVTKSVDEIALEVIRGDWGAGDERKQRLTAAGYDYSAVQAKVNEMLNPAESPVKNPVAKSVDDIALEVIRGDWGAGDERKQRLTAAGYDYSAVQARVNDLL